jgi:hypothetical protein
MMRLLFLLASLLQDGQTVIEFPEPPEPAPVIQEERTEPAPNADTFATDQLYLIQSDISLVILASPAGVLQVTPAKQGAVIFSRFAGGSGLEEKQITRANGYVVRGLAAGTAELLILPAGSADVTDLRRRILTVTAAQTTPPDERPRPPADDVAAAFRAYEAAWREAQGQLADRLESGEITSEKLAADWFGAANVEARKQAFLPLLRAESVVFGGEAWTAEKHAKYVRRYSGAATRKSTQAE